MARDQEVPEAGAVAARGRLVRDRQLLAVELQGSSGRSRRPIADEQRLFDARRARLVATVPAVPAVLWFALVAGALAMVAFCYIFGVENRPAQLVMTAILVGLIGILFVVIEEFSTPFAGSVRISPDGWLYLQQRLPHIM